MSSLSFASAGVTFTTSTTRLGLTSGSHTAHPYRCGKEEGPQPSGRRGAEWGGGGQAKGGGGGGGQVPRNMGYMGSPSSDSKAQMGSKVLWVSKRARQLQSTDSCSTMSTACLGLTRDPLLHTPSNRQDYNPSAVLCNYLLSKLGFLVIPSCGPGCNCGCKDTRQNCIVY
jgi:hypothetical protein